jgi:hypothetical protein
MIKTVSILDCRSNVFYPVLSVSLDCPFLIAALKNVSTGIKNGQSKDTDSTGEKTLERQSRMDNPETLVTPDTKR